MGDALHARGIVYAPDFVINAGGVINIAEELGGPLRPEPRRAAACERIADTLAAVFARSRERQRRAARRRRPPGRGADRRRQGDQTRSGRRPVPAGMIPLRDNVPTRQLPDRDGGADHRGQPGRLRAGRSTPPPSACRRTWACRCAVSGFDRGHGRVRVRPVRAAGPLRPRRGPILLGFEDGRRGVRPRAATCRCWRASSPSMFMHGSWEHVLGNMLFLWIFGNNIEDRVGRRRFLVFYLLGGLAGGAARSSWPARARTCPTSAPRARSRPCSAATWCCTRAPR